MFKKEKSYLACYHPTTIQCTCRLTWNRREDYKAWCRLQFTFKKLECSSSVLVNRVYRTPQGVPEFPGVYHRDGVYRSVPDVCSPRTVTSPHIQCSLAQCANLSQALKSYTGECKLSLFSRLFVGNVGQVTITYPS